MSQKYNDDIDDEEEQEEEEQQLTKENVNKLIDWLEPYTLNAINRQGFYTVTTEDIPEYDEDGDLIETDNEEEGQGPKQRQVLKPVAISDVVDFSKKPPEIKPDFSEQNIVYCYGTSSFGEQKIKKQIYFGKISLMKDVANGKANFYLVPHGDGRIYEDKKCVYAGYFNNGKRTDGILYEKNGDAFLMNFKGNEQFVEHGSSDLLVPFDLKNNKLDRKQYNATSYKNILGKDDNIEFDKIENITLQIDNGYEHDFEHKTTPDFVNEKGDILKYNPEKEEQMKIDVEAVVETLGRIIDQCKGVKNIEIKSLNNFGFLKGKDNSSNDQDEKKDDKQQNEKIEKNLMEAILLKLANKIRGKNINLFFRNQHKSATVADGVGIQFATNEDFNTSKSDEKVYQKYNNDTFCWENFKSEEEYKKALENCGYFNGVVKSKKNEKPFSRYTIGEINDLKNKDYIEKLKQKQKIADQEKIKKMKEEEQKVKNAKVNQLHTSEFNKKELSAGEMAIVALAGIVFPVVGGIIAYYLFSRPDDKTFDNKDKEPDIYFKQTKQENNNNQKKGDQINKKPIMNNKNPRFTLNSRSQKVRE